ncbi:MAG TPA: hypothetical protein VF188_16250 [Longimicrobiales bacterium]|jgi:hypothetical protein
MKRALIAAAFLFTAADAAADDGPCERLEFIARTAMEARQSGIALRDAIEAAGGDSLIVAMVKEAYSKPIVFDPTLRRLAINEFAGSIYLWCLNEVAE